MPSAGPPYWPGSCELRGEITGWFNTNTPSGRIDGFVRTPDGTITTFAVGDATTPLSINPSGEITGYYDDVTGIHGFLRKP